MNLSELAQSIMIMIAMTADDNQVSDRDTYNQWSEALAQAVDDGLEQAAERSGVWTP